MSNNKLPDITPAQALKNLAQCSETVSCDGPTRDALRECVRILEAIVPADPSSPSQPATASN